METATNASGDVEALEPANPRAEIVALLRGGFSVPVIATLGIRGVLDQILSGTFTITDSSSSILVALLDYLSSQGLLTRSVCIAAPDNGGRSEILSYMSTALGKKVLARWGSFAIFNSYSAYFHHLGDLLDARSVCHQPSVRRLENVIGSGEAHRRKFFPVGLDMITRTCVDVLVDLGCGDGHFASALCDRQRPTFVLGVDLDQQVVTVFRRRLRHLADCEVCTVDASDVPTWAPLLQNYAEQRTVVCAWFVLHEFCRSSVSRARAFFETTAALLPTAELLVGEVVAHPPERLAKNRSTSALPELQLFHALSGQGLLSWEQLQELKASIPYNVVAEHSFDPIYDGIAKSYPSNIIWHLAPKTRAEGAARGPAP